MAKETYLATQLQEGARPRTLDDHGKVRIQYFIVDVEVAGDADSEIELCDLPPNAVRVIPNMSYIESSAFGAGRTLDIGHRAYRTTSDYAVEPQDEDFTAFAENLDIAAAGTTKLSDKLKHDTYSKGEVRVVARVQGGSVPVGAKLQGYIVYVYE